MLTLAGALAALWIGVLLTAWLAPKWNHPINPLAWVFTFYRTQIEGEWYWGLSIHGPRKPGVTR